MDDIKYENWMLLEKEVLLIDAKEKNSTNDQKSMKPQIIWTANNVEMRLNQLKTEIKWI